VAAGELVHHNDAGARRIQLVDATPRVRGVAMGTRRRRSDRAGRAPVGSVGRPTVYRHQDALLGRIADGLSTEAGCGGQVAGAWVGAEVAGGDEWPSTIR
jgi:hypothetical protein